MPRKRKTQNVEAKAELIPVAEAPAVAVDELPQKLEEAKASGAYMVVVWRVQDGQLHYFRTTSRFPIEDLAEAQKLLLNDLGPLMIQRQ